MSRPALVEVSRGLAQFGKGLVGGELHVLLGEASQNGFRLGRPQA